MAKKTVPCPESYESWADYARDKYPDLNWVSYECRVVAYILPQLQDVKNKKLLSTLVNMNDPKATKAVTNFITESLKL